MTATSGEMYAVGARRAVLFKLNALGYPMDGPSPDFYPAAAHTPYEGIEVLGAKSFELNYPAVRKISHVGNDRVLAFDFLPAIEGGSGTLTVAGRSLVLDAMLSGVLPVTVGEAVFAPMITDKQGSESDVGLIVFQQAKDATLRTRRYRMQVVPKGVIAITPPGQNENPAETKYEVAINPTTQHLWGHVFSVADEGCLEAGVVEVMTEGRPNVVAWRADNVETNFDLPTAKPATATAKIHAVYVDGVISAAAGSSITQIIPTAKPTAGQIVVCIYEY